MHTDRCPLPTCPARSRRPPRAVSVKRAFQSDIVGAPLFEARADIMRPSAPADAAGEGGWYEEYHPYGTTAWRAPGGGEVSAKRYRYTGMERDEETGLQCHGVRYYCCWLGRWVSADPIELGDGPNRFQYCQMNPAKTGDPSGTLGEPLVDKDHENFTREEYAKLVEDEQGKPISAIRKIPMTIVGCAGVAIGTFQSDEEILRTMKADPKDLPLPNWPIFQLPFERTFGDITHAKEEQVRLNATFATTDSSNHAMIFLFRFDAGDPSAGYAKSFQPDPMTGQVKMSAYDPNHPGTSGLSNYDTAWLDESTQTLWGGDVGGRWGEVVHQTFGYFNEANMGHVNPQTVYSVVITNTHDPTKARVFPTTTNIIDQIKAAESSRTVDPARVQEPPRRQRGNR